MKIFKTETCFNDIALFLNTFALMFRPWIADNGGFSPRRSRPNPLKSSAMCGARTLPGRLVIPHSRTELP